MAANTAHFRPTGVLMALTTRKPRLVQAMILLTCSALLCSACTSTSMVHDKAGVLPPLTPEKRLRIELTDGNTLEAEPYHYAVVREPADFNYGVGSKINLRTGESEEFKGRLDVLHGMSRDTLLSSGWMSLAAAECIEFAIDETTAVRFLPSDLVRISSSAGPGLWVAGKLNARGSSTKFCGRIGFEAITKIEKIESAPVATALLVALVGAAVLGLAAAGSGLSGPGSMKIEWPEFPH